jgi:tetratricopeptide (TPR) repeat protein
MVILSILWNTGLRFPIFFHLLAVVAHALATVLVFRVLRRAMSTPASAVGALWFAVHPVHIEAVANVANSSEVLVAVATLSLALMLLRADSRTEPPASIGWTTAVAAGAIFAAAVLTKESGVAAPVLALLAVWAARRPDEGQDTPWLVGLRAAWSRWWRVAVSCTVVLVAVVAARFFVLQSLVSRQSIAAEGLEGLSAWQRTWAMLSLGPKIAELLLWPRELNPLYGPRPIAGVSGPNMTSVAFIVAVALLAWGAWRLAQRGDRRMAWAMAWIVIAFAPASNLLVPTGQVLAERTLYVSSVGIALLLGVGVHAGLQALTAAGAAWQRPLLYGSAIAVLVLTVVAARSTSQRSQMWRDHGALFSQAIKADSGNYRPYWELAKYAMTLGQHVPATRAYERAYALAGEERDLLADYSAALMKLGAPGRASVVATQLMKFPEARRDPAAVTVYLQAYGLTWGPDSLLVASRRLYADAPLPTTAFFIGGVLEQRRDVSAAIEAYRKGLNGTAADTAGMRRLRERLGALSRK